MWDLVTCRKCACLTSAQKPNNNKILKKAFFFFIWRVLPSFYIISLFGYWYFNTLFNPTWRF